ncbi:hypothetical protein [Parahaliea aestuarii]|uniref:Uncharacterized protein n=1 Tax=Parahaliea aestuarii TaxID=1852021 RepID=A0A5C8ZL78_9GAMM|nr:hypothetical protein [Parahaliea aestuarii]TXS89336.1 hypothetical protein FVW59_17615 [Parahaliea aestuarii]
MKLHLTWRTAGAAALLLALLILAFGSWRDPEFWRGADRRGDHLMKAKDYKAAAAAYSDPWRKAVAQYRNGDFEDAARTFARVPGADGAFDQGNAWLMHGAYEDAVKSYDRALGFRPGWTAAEENKALAIARKKKIDDAGKNRDQESADAYTPDDIAFDQRGDQKKQPPSDMNQVELSDAELRSTWLRRVQTSPGDFLRAKFAYQAAHRADEAPAAEEPTP